MNARTQHQMEATGLTALPRILFVRNCRGITDITGAERYLLTILSGLMAAGCDVHLLCSDMTKKGETPWITALKQSGIPHSIVNVPRIYALSDLRATSKAVRSFAPDVIHAMDHRSDAIAVWVSSRSGLPAVASFFGWTNWEKSTLRGRLYPLFDRQIMRRLSKIIVDSAHIGAQIRSASPGSQVAVIQNGVDMTRFDVDRVQAGFKSEWFGREDIFLVGMIGRIHPNKGHSDAAEAAATLLADNPDFRFVVLGDPPSGYEDFAQELKGKLNQLGIADQFLITNVPSSDIPRAIASFDVTAIPSYMESLSYVMLESMAMKTPVVSARVGGHGDLIEHGTNGFLFEPGDIAQLTILLRDLSQDPQMIGRVGQAGYDTVKASYSTEAMVARTLSVYDEVQQ